MGKKILFEDEDNAKVRINKKFSKSFNEKKEKEFLSKHKMDDEESGSESSEEEIEDEGKNEDWHRQFLKIMPLLKNRDQVIFDKKKGPFFSKFEETDEGERVLGDEQEKEDGKEFYGVKEYVRDKVVNAIKKNNYDDNDVFENDDDGDHDHGDEVKSKYQEENILKKEFLQAADEDLGGHDNIIMKKRVKSSEEKDKEDKDYREFLLKRKFDGEAEVNIDDIADFWTSKNKSKSKGKSKTTTKNIKNKDDENENDSEGFLRKYLWNQMWLDDENFNEEDEEDDDDGGGADLSKDEEDLDEQDRFESKYNFRFEEGNPEIMTYSRNVDSSLRRKENKRIKKRENVNERKLREKKQKDLEIAHAKNLKRKQIKKKLDDIKQISGIQNLELSEKDLEGNFDEEKFDSLMQKMFDEEYYEEEESNRSKPPKSNIDDEVVSNNNNINEDMPEKRNKEINDLIDDYYNLDYEDIVGGIPTRFKYVQVKPDYYGLDPEKIFSEDDLTLNRKISIKRLRPYRGKGPVNVSNDTKVDLTARDSFVTKINNDKTNRKRKSKFSKSSKSKSKSKSKKLKKEPKRESKNESTKESNKRTKKRQKMKD